MSKMEILRILENLILSNMKDRTMTKAEVMRGKDGSSIKNMGKLKNE